MNHVLSCPLCETQLTINEDIIYCENQHHFPKINEQAFFLPLFQDSSWSDEQIEQLNLSLKKNNFERYIKIKKIRNIIEPYAAFQPFNESFQVLLNCLPSLKKALKPGDIILDTWCRTGWSGDFLANYFPEQEVISIWEGDNSVLGYKGFQSFFSSKQKAKNHTIIFHDCNKKLPIKDRSISFCFAYDTLHRYEGVIDELFRVTKSDGIINYAHVHLSNSEPEPYFKRDGVLRSGNYYDKVLKKHPHRHNREIKICSEIDIYCNENDVEMKSTPETEHYNGFIWISPEQYCYISKPNLPYVNASTVLFNPLMYFNSLNKLCLSLEDENTKHILQRHPILDVTYPQNLRKHMSLSEKLREVRFPCDIDNLISQTVLTFDEIDLLIDNKILFVSTLSSAMIKAQSMHMNL
jgi:hypothetical protein